MAETEIKIPDSGSLETGEPDRDRARILGIILIIILAIALLFLVRGCEGSSDSSIDGGVRSIESPTGVEPVRGAVSVLIADDTPIETVLRSASLTGLETIDLGEGRYVISVAEGTELQAARALLEADGVQDAGFVYEDDTLQAPEQP